MTLQHPDLGQDLFHLFLLGAPQTPRHQHQVPPPATRSSPGAKCWVAAAFAARNIPDLVEKVGHLFHWNTHVACQLRLDCCTKTQCATDIMY